MAGSTGSAAWWRIVSATGGNGSRSTTARSRSIRCSPDLRHDAHRHVGGLGDLALAGIGDAALAVHLGGRVQHALELLGIERA